MRFVQFQDERVDLLAMKPYSVEYSCKESASQARPAAAREAWPEGKDLRPSASTYGSASSSHCGASVLGSTIVRLGGSEPGKAEEGKQRRTKSGRYLPTHALVVFVKSMERPRVAPRDEAERNARWNLGGARTARVQVEARGRKKAIAMRRAVGMVSLEACGSAWRSRSVRAVTEGVKGSHSPVAMPMATSAVAPVASAPTSVYSAEHTRRIPRMIFEGLHGGGAILVI